METLFSQASIDFLWGVSLNNHRSWFQAHRQEFLDHVDAPLRALAREVTARMQEQYPRLELEVRVSRIYRDARRLHGRGPYKDHLWFVLRPNSDRDTAIPCFYFEIAPDCYSMGVGTYDATPMTMAKLRARIDRDPKPMERIVRKLNRCPQFKQYAQQYKRPKGDPGPLLYPWYNAKQVGISADYNCEGVLFTPELADQVVEHFQLLQPLYTYLRSLALDPPPEHI